MLDLSVKIKKFFAYSKEEIKSLTIIILLLGFVIGFNDGGNTNSVGAYYAFNMISSILIIALAVLVHVSIQRIVALQAGFKLVFNIWWYGIAISLILAFLSNGKLWILLPGGFVALMLEKHRLGKFRYGINYWPLGLIGFSGPLANMMLALFFRLISNISFLTGNVLIEKAIIVNITYALWTNLCIPPLDGFYLMYSSRLSYVFSYGLLIGAAILIMFKLSVLFTIIGTFLFAILVVATYYWNYEK